MTAKEMMSAIGKYGHMKIGDSPLTFEIEILDVRKCWDRVDYLIRPLAGAGESWVSARTIKIVEA